MFLEKVARNLPERPRRRYHVVAGTHDWNEGAKAAAALAQGSFRDEEVIGRYEAAFARAVGVPHAVSFGAARMGLYVVLEAMGVARGDEVILSAYTCVAVPNALYFLGARPVYADIDPVTFNVTAESIARAITPRTRAIVLQHTFGLCADVGAVRELADRHGIRVIEDAAHSLGSRWRGVPSGALGDAAVFSTDRSKVISTLLGGMVTTRDAALAGKLKAIQAATQFMPDAVVRRILSSFLFELAFYSPGTLWLGHSAAALFRNLRLLFYYSDRMMDGRPSEYPYPCRLSSSQAAIGLSQLGALDANLRHRREVASWLESRARWYGEAFSAESSCLRYPLLVRKPADFISRFKERFELKGWFSVPFERVPGRPDITGYEPGSCPVAEKVSQHMVALPTHPKVPLGAIEREWARHEDWIQANLVRL